MSWDHLSSKALLHIPPDRTIVWNDVQKREAMEMHGIAADSIVVTGAQCYDQWFDKTSGAHARGVLPRGGTRSVEAVCALRLLDDEPGAESGRAGLREGMD